MSLPAAAGSAKYRPGTRRSTGLHETISSSIQRADGIHYTLEQDELFRLPDGQIAENPGQIDLEGAIRSMSQVKEIRIPVEW
jgi:hypothetical protein